MKRIHKYMMLLVVLPLVGAGIGYGWSKTKQTNYIGRRDLLIQKSPEKVDEGVYAYDGYYVQLAEKNHVKTVLTVCNSRNVANSVSKIKQNSASTSSGTNTLKIECTNPSQQVLRLIVTSDDSQIAQQGITALYNEMQSQNKAINQNVLGEFHLKPLDSEASLETVVPETTTPLVTGLLAGGIIAILFTAISEYLSRESEVV